MVRVDSTWRTGGTFIKMNGSRSSRFKSTSKEYRATLPPSSGMTCVRRQRIWVARITYITERSLYANGS